MKNISCKRYRLWINTLGDIFVDININENV